MNQQTWDAIIIGGGAAGLSAAQTLGRSLRRTLVIDGGEPRNRFTEHIHNVLGLDGKSPAVLAEIGRAEASRYDVEFREGLVQSVSEVPGGLRVVLAGGSVEAALDTRALIVATGVTDVLPSIPGVAERWGRSVLHCPYCHGWEVRGRRIGVVTTSPMGLHQAKLVRQWSEDVTVFTAGVGELEEEVARAFAARGVVVVADPVTRLEGEGEHVSAVVTEGGVYPVDAVFVVSSMQPRDSFLENLELERRDEMWGSVIATDPMGRASHPGVWAAGNVVQAMATVPVAMGAGAMVGSAVNSVLVEEDYARAIEAADAEAGLTEAGLTGAHGHGPGQGAGHGIAGAGHDPNCDPAEFWESHYGGAGPVWSGKVNATLAAVAAEIAPGRALDLGCGEGGDAIWLAQQGWRTTGIDISQTATARATAAAAAAGFSEDQLRFVVADLTSLNDQDAASLGLTDMDLVTASFFQSPLEFDRSAILRAAAALVAPGGHLVLVSHAAPPSWADIPEEMAHKFPSPDEELAGLALDAAEWHTLRAEIVTREITSHEGQASTIDDTLVVLRRAQS